mmetsp:Transcript_29521/g.38105  ORF Transcript_29521/g.38105 Transcript_29521/m.38105 type:complete len:147 (-) Transcript_29521:252-692(-)
MTVFVAAKSRAKSVSFESNVFYTYKLKRSNKKKKKYTCVMSSDQYQNDDTVNRVAVISPPTRKKCTKLTNSPLSAHISNSMSCHTSRSTIDNAWRQQYLCESQSLLKLYMNSDYFEVDTSHNHMPIRVTPERMYRRMDRSVRIEYK